MNMLSPLGYERKISQKKILNKNIQKEPQKNQNFNGAVDVAFNILDKGFTQLDKNAMIQVAFVDSVFTDIPRTLVDLKTGIASALETGRREFSGLIINCLIPGVIVKGIANLLPKSAELKSTKAASSWANGDTIDKLKGVYEQVQSSGVADKTREFVAKSLGAIEGLDGKTWVKYSDYATNPKFNEAIDTVVEAMAKTGKERKQLLDQAQKKIASLTKAESVLRFNGVAHSTLNDTLRDVVDLGSSFNKVKEKAIQGVQENGQPAVSNALNKYTDSLKKLVNKKSGIGMVVVIALAISMQKINRAITRKQFKAEGAPIYKDFGKKDTTQKMDEKQKKKFFAKKVASAIGMFGLAGLSMMKKPSKEMFQFSGIFPTMDQCRWIASSTFASRMLAAEDENELRESTVRDLVSFSGLYFLGDYVKKSVASGFEAMSKTNWGSKIVGKNVVLLNRKKEIAKPILQEGATFMQKAGAMFGFKAKQLGNWIKNTELKTAMEVSSTNVRNLRNLCRVADIAFSGIMLGYLLPKYNRKVTEKKVAQAQAQAQEQAKAEAQKVAQKQSFMITQNVPYVFKPIVEKSQSTNQKNA